LRSFDEDIVHDERSAGRGMLLDAQQHTHDLVIFQRDQAKRAGRQENLLQMAASVAGVPYFLPRRLAKDASIEGDTLVEIAGLVVAHRHHKNRPQSGITRIHAVGGETVRLLYTETAVSQL